MPVRSSNSSVLRWPDRQTIDRATRGWAETLRRQRPHVLRIGYFGSYARGQWGVGSDLDVIVIVKASPHRFERRSAEWNTTELAIPVDLFVYTRDEWEAFDRQSRFYQTALREAVWVYNEQCAVPEHLTPDVGRSSAGRTRSFVRLSCRL